ELPPLLAAPGLRGHLHCLVLERLRGIARNGVETPRELAGLGVVRGDVAADAVFTAAHADDDASLHHARRPRDGKVLVVAGDHAPRGLAGFRVERHQAAVERADVDLPFPCGDTAVDDVAAALHATLARDLWIVGPEQLAARRVVRLDHAPRGRYIHHAVD